MEGLNADVGAMQPSLEQAPEVFHEVRVDAAVHVLHRMVDSPMVEVAIQANVGVELVCVEQRSRLDGIPDIALQCPAPGVTNDLGAHVAAALDHPENDGLVLRAATSNRLAARSES